MISTTRQSASAMASRKSTCYAAKRTINDKAPAAYRGLERFEARTRILADLQRGTAGRGKSRTS